MVIVSVTKIHNNLFVLNASARAYRKELNVYKREYLGVYRVQYYLYSIYIFFSMASKTGGTTYCC